LSHSPDRAGIPQALHNTLNERKAWRELLALLENLADEPSVISDAQLRGEWDAFVPTLTTSCESAAGILIQILVCIGRHRPEMIDALLPDALDPLFCLEADEPASILAWYAAHKQLDAGTKAWIREQLPAYLERFEFDPLDAD